MQTTPPSGLPPRQEPREVVELRRLKAASPHLATAVDFHLALIDLDRSVRGRIMLPRTLAKDTQLAERLSHGHRLIEFDDLSIDWSDLRRVLREATALLQRFEMIEVDEGDALLAIVRDAGRLPPLLRHWYDAVIVEVEEGEEPLLGPGQAHACLLGMRSFLAPAAAAMLQRHDVEGWQRSSCPVCGGEPDFSVWTGERRRLVCARCCGQWTFPDGQCPFCQKREPAAGHFFSSGSRTYRVDTCDGCHRYLKGFDESRASRGFLLSVDAVATLPLDAAAQQLGYL